MRLSLVAGAGAIFVMIGGADAAPALDWNGAGAGPVAAQLPARDPFGAVALAPYAEAGLALKGLSEFADGTWRLKPYVGFRAGALDSGNGMHATLANDWVSGYQVKSGLGIGLTQKLIGNFEYRWSYGEKGHFAFGNMPAKLELSTNRVLIGLDYHLF